jgi:hypothetical protein
VNEIMAKSKFKLIVGVGVVAAAVALTTSAANAGKTQGLTNRSRMNTEIVTGTVQPKTAAPTKKSRAQHQ